MKAYLKGETRLRISRIAARLLMISVLLALFAAFAGCGKDASPTEIPEETEAVTSTTQKETEPVETSEQKETVIDVPFYYMVFRVYDTYDFDINGFGVSPLSSLRIATDTEDLQDSRAYNDTIVVTGYQKTSRIKNLMADRYTEEFFETHDLIFYYNQEAFETYHDVVSLRNTDRGTEMTLRNYDNGGAEWAPIHITLIEVPKGYIKNYPAIYYETVHAGDPLYNKLTTERSKAERHHFPGGVMEDVRDWEPADIPEKDTASAGIPEKEKTGTDIPFYYMIFKVDNAEDIDRIDINTGVPFGLWLFTDSGGFEDLLFINNRIVNTGKGEALRIGDLAAERYTEEFFETHDLVLYFIREPYETYHDVVSLRNTDRGMEMTLRNYDKGGPELASTYITLIEVPKGYIKIHPAVYFETVHEGTPLYQELAEERREAERHHFPGGVMEDVHDWEPTE